MDNDMTYFIGIDIGARMSKGVITEQNEITAYSVVPSGTNYRKTAQMLRKHLLLKANLHPQNIACSVATGVGGQNVAFSQKQTAEFRCCARGISRSFPEVRTVIDIGETSSRVIRVSNKGQIVNFVVSEKCAVGSGYFLYTIANVLRIRLEEIGPLSLKSKRPVAFTTGCAVFGESEAVSRISQGFAKEDILVGVHIALANKISMLVNRIGFDDPCAVTGGGGLDIGLIRVLEEVLGVDLIVPPMPQIITALGAAIMAEEMTK